MFSTIASAFVTAALVPAIYVAAGPPVPRHSCDIVACGSTLLPLGIDCVEAAAKRGMDPFADINCAKGVLDLGIHTPSDCVFCFEADPFGKEIIDKIGNLFNEANNNCKPRVSQLLLPAALMLLAV